MIIITCCWCRCCHDEEEDYRQLPFKYSDTMPFVSFRILRPTFNRILYFPSHTGVQCTTWYHRPMNWTEWNALEKQNENKTQFTLFSVDCLFVLLAPPTNGIFINVLKWTVLKEKKKRKTINAILARKLTPTILARFIVTNSYIIYRAVGCSVINMTPPPPSSSMPQRHRITIANGNDNAMEMIKRAREKEKIPQRNISVSKLDNSSQT